LDQPDGAAETIIGLAPSQPPPKQVACTDALHQQQHRHDRLGLGGRRLVPGKVGSLA